MGQVSCGNKREGCKLGAKNVCGPLASRICDEMRISVWLLSDCRNYEN